MYTKRLLGDFDYSVVSAFLALPAIDLTLDYLNAEDRYTFPSPILIGKYRNDRQEV